MPRNLFQDDSRYGRQSNPNQNDGLLNSLANSAPVNFVLGAGDAVRNTMSGAADFLPGVNIDPVQSSEGGAYNLGNAVGNIGAFMGGGEVLDAARLGAILKAPAMAKRIAGATAFGATVNPQDRLGGAIEGAAGGMAGESLPIIGKGLGQISEYMSGNKFTKSLVNEMRDVYKTSTNQVSELMNPITDKFGNFKFYKKNPSQEFLNIDNETLQQLPAALRREYKNIVENPNEFTFQAGHDFQKKLGDNMGELMGDFPGPAKREAIAAFKTVRDSLKEDMASFLKQNDNNAAHQWKYASDKFRDEVAPFRSDATIRKLVSDKKETISPKQLQSRLTNIVEGHTIPQDHYLSGALRDLSMKINKGEAAKNLVGLGGSILGGAAAGGSMGGLSGGMAGALGGAGLGTYAAKALSHPVLDLATNPAIEEVAQKMKVPYQFLVKALLANKL